MSTAITSVSYKPRKRPSINSLSAGDTFVIEDFAELSAKQHLGTSPTPFMVLGDNCGEDVPAVNLINGLVSHFDCSLVVTMVEVSMALNVDF